MENLIDRLLDKYYAWRKYRYHKRVIALANERYRQIHKRYPNE